MDLPYQNKCMPFLFCSIAFLMLSVNWKMALFFYSLTPNGKIKCKTDEIDVSVCLFLAVFSSCHHSLSIIMNSFAQRTRHNFVQIWIPLSSHWMCARWKKVTFHFGYTYEKSQLQQRLIEPNFSLSKIIKKCIRIHAETQRTSTKHRNNPNA